MAEIDPLIIVGALCIAGAVAFAVKSFVDMPDDERGRLLSDIDTAKKDIAHGEINNAIICPHCQAAGMTRTKRIEKKRGISGTKATAALLTGGVSLLATGLSRKENMTEAYCDNCKSTWTF